MRNPIYLPRLNRKQKNSFKAVILPLPRRRYLRTDPSRRKRIIKEGSHVTTTNTTMPKSSSSSRTSKQLGSSSKEEDAPFDQVQSQIPHLSQQEEE
ncbi:hypothetical protein HA466_0122220 [Hirschfeldia incana]|nr:hypothetical protein HA466_0122220 [Hirschfeldia incana]